MSAEVSRSAPWVCILLCFSIFVGNVVHLIVWSGCRDIYLEEIRVFQAGFRLEYVSMG